MEQNLEPLNQREEQLNNQNQFLKIAFNALAYPFIVINTDDYIVEMANTAAYSGAETGEITCYMLLHGRRQPCSGDDHPCPLEYVKKTKKPVKKKAAAKKKKPVKKVKKTKKK